MPSTADEKRMKSRAASLAYYYANKEAILKAAAEKLKAKRVAEFGSEEAWQAHLERMNREKALAWLETPNPSLQGRSPFEAATTEQGFQDADDILTRIEHGVLG